MKNKLFKVGILFLALLLLPVQAAQAQEGKLIPMQGMHNLRDMGGYTGIGGKTVRNGLLYRGASMENLSDADLEKMAALGIVGTVDFRLPDEAGKAPTRVWPGLEKRFSLPLSPGNLAELYATPEAAGGEERMQNMNKGLAEAAHEEYREFFRIISNPNNLPLLFHCSAGKDRTGFAAAMFLSALGVDRETIMRDYLLSADYLAEKNRPDIEKKPELAPFLTVQASYLQAALDIIDQKYGGVETYLVQTLGVDLERLRSIYLR